MDASIETKEQALARVSAEYARADDALLAAQAASRAAARQLRKVRAAVKKLRPAYQALLIARDGVARLQALERTALPFSKSS
jgi:hypothetical protein